MHTILLCLLFFVPFSTPQSTVAGPDWCIIPSTSVALGANFALDGNAAFIAPIGISPNQRFQWTVNSGYFILQQDGTTIYSLQLGSPNGMLATRASPPTLYFTTSSWKFPSATLLQTIATNGETIKCGILKTQDDGNVVLLYLIQKGTEYRITTDWQAGTTQANGCSDSVFNGPSGSSLTAGQCLNTAGQSQISLNNNKLVLTNTGNLVLYSQDSPLWSTQTSSTNGPFRACLQTDGNFVIYDKDSRVLWATMTNTNPLCTVLRFDKLGSAVIYSVSSSQPTEAKVVWLSGITTTTSCQLSSYDFLIKTDRTYQSISGNSPNGIVKWSASNGYFNVMHNNVVVYTQGIGSAGGSFKSVSVPPTITYYNANSVAQWSYPSAIFNQITLAYGEFVRCGMIRAFDDGNVAIQFLVVKGSQYRIVTDWQSNTRLTPCTTFASMPAVSTLTQGMCLSTAGRSELTSGDTRFVMQTDGNLVIYKGGNYVWDSKTLTTNLPVRACLQNDGNFVIYDKDSRYLWATMTNTDPLCSMLQVESTGKVTISAVQRSTPSQIQVVWST